MGSGEAAGGETAADARAQEVKSADPAGSELGAPVPLADVLGNMPTAAAADEVRRQQESLERRAADQDLIRELAAGDFGGRRYQRFEEELARYGISVLRGWMYSGVIFKLLRARGFLLYPSDRELEELFRDPEVREDLATMTVAFALPQFRKRALIDGGWRYDGGASLTTYFMGACQYVFPNEFRKRRVEQKKWRRANNQELATLEPEAARVTDPAAIVTGDSRVREVLERLDERTRAIVALTLAKYTQEEIRELLDEAKLRGVEGVLHRWRTKEQQRLKGGERDA